MGRVYLIIIILGGIIAAMLPSGKRSPPSSSSESSGFGTFSSTSSHRTLRVPTPSPSPTAIATGGGWTTLNRSSNGHFFADAQVNGMTVHFLIDTGASGVALTTEDARRVGLQFSEIDFTPVGSGASGEVRGKLVSLDQVSLAGHSVDNVSGVILEGGEISLLGQSFLSQMGTIEISGDRMTIR
ncbi:MAG: TIGR02281 family clan AA aspartic protease [Sphingomicrobium sp.]